MQVIVNKITIKYKKPINKIRIFHIDEFKKKCSNIPIDIGVITVLARQAQNVADMMIKCGIKAIWNFSTHPILVPENILVENTSINSGIAMIKWKLNKNKPLIYKNRIL